jgi:protein-S-isoprenylcysteine O-methyltransferase Ste14
MEKLSFLGIGPKIALITFPFLVIAVILSIVYPNMFVFIYGADNTLLIAGILVLVTGFGFYLVTVRYLLLGLRNTRLITTGTYALCQNPLYAVFILLLIPGIALVMNSWLILTTALPAYGAFRLFIASEYKEMERVFGKPYLDYKQRTPEFFPFAFRKWFGKKDR